MNSESPWARHSPPTHEDASDLWGMDPCTNYRHLDALPKVRGVKGGGGVRKHPPRPVYSFTFRLAGKNIPHQRSKPGSSKPPIIQLYSAAAPLSHSRSGCHSTLFFLLQLDHLGDIPVLPPHSVQRSRHASTPAASSCSAPTQIQDTKQVTQLKQTFHSPAKCVIWCPKHACTNNAERCTSIKKSPDESNLA